MKSDRLFGIVYLLLANGQMSARELAEHFEVSRRTIYRDIDSLSAMNVPLYMNKGRNGGIAMMEGYTLDKAMFSDEEQTQILCSLLESQSLHATEAKGLQEKLQSMFAKQTPDIFSVDFSVWGDSKHHQETFAQIKEALLRQQVITFSYCGSDGVRTSRCVEPLKLLFKHQAWYLAAYDRTKKAQRMFKLMRMREVRRSNQRFDKEKHHLSDLEWEWTNTPQTSIELRLAFAGTAAYRVYDEFDEETIVKNEDGSFTVTVRFPMNEWVYGYLLSFGDQLRVLAPQEVKEELRSRLCAMLALYEKQ